MTLPSVVPSHKSPPAAPSPSKPAASQKLGPWTATALVVGNIIGVGVFVLPVSLAPYGWASLMGWALTIVGALCLAWVFATLARHLPNAGGAMGIVRLAFGGDTAFLNAWGYWVSCCAANAIIAIGGVSYLGKLIPALEHSRSLSTAVSLGLLWALVGVNLRGLRTAGQLQLITSILKMWPFIAAFAVVVVLLLASTPMPVQPIDPSQFTIGAAFTTTTLTLYTMLGIECAAVPADAVENASSVVPRATVIGTVLSGVLVMGLCVALVVLMPAAKVAASSAPLVDFVASGLGATAAALVSGAVVISALGCLNGWVLLSGEIPAAMSMAGELPAWWGVRNANGGAINALVVSQILASGLVLFNGSSASAGAFTFIVQLATATNLLLYVLAPLAALRFMRTLQLPRTRALSLAAIGAILFGAVAIIGSGAPAVAWGTALVLAGWPLYRLVKRRVAVSV